MREKVLIVASVASMIERFNKPNIRLLISKGFDVEIACNFDQGSSIPKKEVLNFKNDMSKLNVKCHQIDFMRNPFNIIKTYKAYNQLKWVCKNNKYKFVHCHTPIGGAITRIVFKNTETRVIYTAHGFHFHKGARLRNWLIYYPIEKILSKWTDILITINEEDYNLSLKKLRSKNNIKINGVGVDTKKFFESSELKKNIIREKIGLKSDDKIILMIGELNSNKNHFPVIESIKSIRNDIPNIKLLIAGQGAKKEKLQNYIDKNNLSENVKLLGFRSDVKELLQASNLLISTSLREGLPVNVIEALSSSLPVIVSGCRGNVDLVKNNYNGIILDGTKGLNIKESVIKVFKDYRLYERLKNNAKISSQIYDIEVIMRELEEIYSNIDNDDSSK